MRLTWPASVPGRIDSLAGRPGEQPQNLETPRKSGRVGRPGMTLAKVKEQDGMTLAKVRHAQVSHAPH